MAWLYRVLLPDEALTLERLDDAFYARIQKMRDSGELIPWEEVKARQRAKRGL